MKMKMKNRSQRNNINRSRSWHGYKYSKYKKCLSTMMLLCIKQHINNILSSIHEKVEAELKKSVAYKIRHVDY